MLIILLAYIKTKYLRIYYLFQWKMKISERVSDKGIPLT